jgi:hypothetical protein
VKTKKQALAVADTLTAPAEAERRRQVEARQLQWFGKIPALSAVPEADRSAVLQAAQQYAGRRWYVYGPLLTVAIWAVLSVLAPQVLEVLSISRIPAGLFAVATIATLWLYRRALRSYVAREAAEYIG